MPEVGIEFLEELLRLLALPGPSMSCMKDLSIFSSRFVASVLLSGVLAQGPVDKRCYSPAVGDSSATFASSSYDC